MLINKWAGRISNSSPHDIPPGATQEQTNVRCRKPGILEVRQGNRPVTFANAAAQVTGADVIALHGFKRPEAQWVIALLSDGKLRIGRTPS